MPVKPPDWPVSPRRELAGRALTVEEEISERARIASADAGAKCS